MEFDYPVYEGDDLGANYTEKETFFRLWAPSAENVVLRLYPDGGRSGRLGEYRMEKAEKGTWVCRFEGDMKNIYYTYQATIGGIRQKETIDPYAKACGVNGKRGMICDLKDTDPRGFSGDSGPYVISPADMVIEEISIADMTGDPSCHAMYPASYLGLTEEGLKTDAGDACGIDHLAGMGITHVQIMPFYDFATADEAHLEKKHYNWGYDPMNYNIPEGSYSTDPFHGDVRIKECKQMIQSLHKKGIGVIMDVVYNHVYDAGDFCFQQLVPGYFFRYYEGKLSNGSGCGNEVCSENPMVRKYIIDSLCYWVKEYHVDGFRFDLMGVLDLETMKQAAKALRKIRPDIVLYGEGWAGGLCSYPEEKRGVKRNISQLPGIGVFSDDIRDRIKGSVFDGRDKGFVTGKQKQENAIRFCTAAGVSHPKTDAGEVCGTVWASSPEQVINYVSCHDNFTLWDKLHISNPGDSDEMLLKFNRLAAAIVFTSQGIPFFLSGEEICRSKPCQGKLSGNSYNLPLSVNSIKYEINEGQKELRDYYRGLISFRKKHPSLRLRTAREIQNHLVFIDYLPKNVVAFKTVTDEEELLIVYNANRRPVTMTFLPNETWGVCIYGKKACDHVIAEARNSVRIDGTSAFAAVRL